MAMTYEFRQAGRIADVVGLPAALAICGFFGRDSARLYIPVTTTDQNHILRKVAGELAFEQLVQAMPGQYLEVPAIDLRPLRNAGMVYRLSRKGISDSDIAQLADISRRQVSFLKSQLRLEGFTELAETIPDDDSENGHD